MPNSNHYHDASRTNKIREMNGSSDMLKVALCAKEE
jgi:hypothetical protein